MYVSKLDTWYFSISAILNYEISVETNVGNHDAIFDCVGHHGYRRSGHMQYTLAYAADWLVSLFNHPVNVLFIFLSQRVSAIKLIQLLTFYHTKSWITMCFCTPQAKLSDVHNHVSVQNNALPCVSLLSCAALAMRK